MRPWSSGYGDKAEWAQVKEAFQHWNLDSGSGFAGQDAANFDPRLVEIALEIAKAMSGQVGSTKRDGR